MSRVVDVEHDEHDAGQHKEHEPLAEATKVQQDGDVQDETCQAVEPCTTGETTLGQRVERTEQALDVFNPGWLVLCVALAHLSLPRATRKKIVVHIYGIRRWIFSV